MALLVVFFALGFVSARNKSGTYDEKGHLSYGRQILETGSFRRNIPRHNSKIPVTALNALPAWGARALDKELPDGRALRYNRLPTLLVGVVLGWLVFAWGREARGVRAGLAAVALFAFSPNLLAHSRLITSDTATSLGVFAACYAFWRFTVRPGWGRLVVAGLALGFGLTTKVSSLLLLPTFGLLALILLLRRRGWPMSASAESSGAVTFGRGALRAATDLVTIFAVALVTINAAYLFEGSLTALDDYELSSRKLISLAEVPVLGAIPVPLPYGYVQGVDMIAMTTDRDRWTYCLGEYRPRGFPHYFAVGLLTKTTVGFLALLASALALLLISFGPGRKSRTGDETGIVDLFLLLPAALWFVYLSFFFHFHIGFRYALPILPLLFVFVGGLAARWPLRSIPGFAVLLALVLHAASSLAVHPHYLAYFNEPSGGPINGWRYLIDSNLDWGQDRAWARRVYPEESEVRVIAYPKGPTAGRLMVNVNALVGLKPHEAKRYAWLRENFEPVDHVGYSFLVYDVTVDDLKRLGFR